ncbi:MAG: hypothetical protein NZ899_10140 [Thermoguttaceae bacterium]|nr:hypothetical protein [Thermoguttaceae bacterium]MDW8078045.1 hypothetical protein [Thermoguttaceae bacterium]
MQIRQSRRQFLLAGGIALAGSMVPSGIAKAHQKFPWPEAKSTEHFWYRLQPEGLYIDSQRGNWAFAFGKDRLYLSDENARTWAWEKEFPEAQKITFSHIFTNGNVLFATSNRLFLSTDRLKTIREVPVLNPDGSVYRPHEPKNPDRPGWYFYSLSGITSWMLKDREILVWGNYCNVLGGASPINIYYSVDNGQTVKLAYSFGRNPHFCDDGSEGGGSTGTPLGNPDNPVLCRHIHSVAYNPAEDAFYCCTGDFNRPGWFECHWLRGAYDWAGDRWDWKVVVSASQNTRYKSGGINCVDGRIWWISDANGPLPHDRGLFSCRPEDLPHTERHTMHYNPVYECGCMVINGPVILAGHLGPACPYHAGIIISLDGGETWAEHDLVEFGKRAVVRIHPPNEEGWYRLELRRGWIERADVLFVKPKI